MKNIKETLKTACWPSLLACALALPGFAHSETGCEIDEYSLFGYLMNPGRVCGGSLTGEDVLSAVKVLDAYWDWDDWDPSLDWIEARKRRFALLSKEYQNALKKEYGWKGGSEYSMPSLGYERDLRGYRIKRILSHSKSNDGKMRIAIDIEWFQEGYQGNMTWIYDMANIDGRWVITYIAF